ncbi:hypothetical protein [Paraburkholderia youngii]|uniref:hypothetical protein n=1 Tax=Paraburkholderia youngii TaxID=2782701 RepID=UPI003D21EC84
MDDVIRSARNTIMVNVEYFGTGVQHPDDTEMAGAYKIAFGKDVSGMSRARLAAVALGIFHATHDLGDAEDFDIVAVDGAGHLILEEEDHPAGKFAGYGTAEKIAEPFDAPRPWEPTLYIQATTNSDFADVAWARLQLAHTVCERLQSHQELCKENNLAAVRSYYAPDAWSGSAQWLADNQSMHVSGQDVWFTATPKNHDSLVSTMPVPLDRLFELLESGKEHEGDRSFACSLGSLYYHGTDANELIRIVEQQDENSGA